MIHQVRKILVPLLSLLLISCAGPVVLSRQDPASTLRSFRQDILSSTSLSPDTLQALRMADFTQRDALEEGFDQSQRETFERYASSIEVLYIESELAIGRAKLVEESLPDKSMALYLLGARLSSLGLKLPECQGPFDLRCDSFKVFYAASIAPLVRYAMANKEKKSETFDSGVGISFSFNLAHKTKFEDPAFYDTLVPSDTIGLEGLANRHRRHGVGLALTGCRGKRPETVYESYLPRVGTCLPLTALLLFDKCTDTSCEAVLEFHDALTHEEAELNGVKVPLAADFTAPFASIIDKTGLGNWGGLISAIDGSEELLTDTGFYSVTPYDPTKIPIITVHGLFSSPITWLSVHNDLLGDPVLRRHYQIFHYLYPTNLPILVNARTFREKLTELLGYMRPLSALQRGEGHVVAISHSMGGILTRLRVIHDSEPIKQYFFKDPGSINDLEPAIRDEVNALMTFSREKAIHRVIFVAVPHRGSEIADNWIGMIGKWLITLPKRVMAKFDSALQHVKGLLKPDVAKAIVTSNASSIQGLSKKNPTLLALAQIPVDPAVPYHSIIGDRGKGNSPNSSDGVVAYGSSHLDGAVSEFIVPADHTAHVHPLAIAELRRILREHLNSAGITK